MQWHRNLTSTGSKLATEVFLNASSGCPNWTVYLAERTTGDSPGVLEAPEEANEVFDFNYAKRCVDSLFLQVLGTGLMGESDLPDAALRGFGSSFPIPRGSDYGW